MKSILNFVLAMGAMASIQVFADDVVRYGHWPVSSIRLGGQNYGHVLVNQNNFTVLSWETIGLIACAKDTYPDAEIIIDGLDGPSVGYGGGVITKATICTGEIALGSCYSGEKTTCP